MVTKKDTLGEIVMNFPEAAPVLASAGLHCIGCQVSAYESLEEGCLAHGLKKKEIDSLVKEINKKIKEFESVPQVSFTQKAVAKLLERVNGKKYARIMHTMEGEFDFIAADSVADGEFVIKASAKDSKKTYSVDVLVDKRIEKLLRGVIIDYDSKEKDFTAKRDKLK